MFRSCISKVEVTGLFKILLYALCFQLAILVGVPTPELINGGVTLVIPRRMYARPFHNEDELRAQKHSDFQTI